MKRVLITGGSGFIGSNLVRRLAGKSEVHLLLREGSNTWRIQDVLEKCTVHRVDLSERERLAKTVKSISPDSIYHLATYGAYSTQKSFDDFVQTNFVGGVNLLDACAGAGFGRFINVSSSSEYGLKDKPMAETDILEPNGLYGITKAAFTNYCSWKSKFENLPITTFRIFAAYGYYEDAMRMFPSLIVPLLRGNAPALGHPDSVRDFIFIEDIIDAFQTAPGNLECEGKILNLGTGTQHTIKEAADIACRLIGTDVSPQWGQIKNRQLEPKMWVADMSNTFKTLGWKPKYDLVGGIGKTIRWFRGNIGHY